MDSIRITDVGDTAFNVEFGVSIDPATNARVTGLRHVLRYACDAGGLVGLVETIPTFRSLMVQYDPLVTSRAELEQKLTEAAAVQPQPELHIRSHAKAKYESVALVMASAQRLGLNKLGIVGSEQFVN